MGREGRSRVGVRAAGFVLAVCGLLACSGQIHESDGPGSGAPRGNGSSGAVDAPGTAGPGSDGPGSSGDGSEPPPGGGNVVDLPMDPDELAQVPLADVAASVSPSPETRLPRLTHVQWQIHSFPTRRSSDLKSVV